MIPFIAGLIIGGFVSFLVCAACCLARGVKSSPRKGAREKNL